MTKEQVITDKYAAYCGDSVGVLPIIPNESVDFSVYSPPFATKGGKALYTYSSSPNDFSNCDTLDQFQMQYEFLIAEIARVTKPGRITAVHITDIMDSSSGELWDFPAMCKQIHRKYGFKHRNTITIWKEPLKVRMRTMVKSLMHKLIVEDSTECFTAMPDYILIFKKTGENLVPVTHEFGLTHYAGLRPLLPEHLSKYGLPISEFVMSGEFDESYDAYVNASFEALRKKYRNHKDPKTNKLSHIIWQRYASSVWDDIRIDNVLPFRDSKEEDDEKHVHPLQLDVVDRLVELYSNPGEVVLTPFMGVGSEVFSPVSMGRKAIGIELKDSYFKQAALNLKEAERRFDSTRSATLFG